MRYVPEKDKKAVMADMKPIYQAKNERHGYERLLEFEEKWGKKYPLSCKSWRDNWVKLSAFFEYDAGIRKIIYTTNPIEGVEQALMKLMYLVIKNISKNGPCQSIIGDWHSLNYILKLVTEYSKKIEASERR